MQVKGGFTPISLLIILTVLVFTIAGGVLFWQRENTIRQLPVKQVESDFSALHQPCDSGQGCPAGLECLAYYGIAGSEGPLLKTCEIVCVSSDSDCPAGLVCTTIVDGPGEVCVVAQE